eukprot:comp21075_c0_seq1/m.28387 comp21075_c0_seq1/g.28387  ORF comp21075_c0_seq1/g.28387 comp21075_c0_seq1/m.28387 type:complete len:474 (-) comp21075_c0_seq1:165-1586(-)
MRIQTLLARVPSSLQGGIRLYFSRCHFVGSIARSGFTLKPYEIQYFKGSTVCNTTALFTRPLSSARHLRPLSTHTATTMGEDGVKVDLPLLGHVLTPEVKALGQLFRENGYHIRLVGGVVRDLLMGKMPKDTDLATDAHPDQVQAMLEKANIRCVPTGLQHGTVTAVLNKTNYEITTLRIDAETDGRHAEVEFTQDWKLDAERRDLTINAMSLDFDGHLFDYFNGREHLENRLVLFVGNADTRIKEDYLRILRYFRFHGRISDHQTHDPDVIKALRDNAAGLRRISGERVWMEMSKILAGNNAGPLLALMYDIGVAEEIGLPLSGRQSIPLMEDVRKHSRDPITVLSALLESVLGFEELFAKWKFSGQERNLGLYIIGNRSWEMTLKFCTDELVEGVEKAKVMELARYKGHPEIADQIKDWPVPRFPVTGKHMKDKGIKPGPHMGELLRGLKQQWKASNYTLTAEDLVATLQA